jgi:GNAT superfamily N-acetyltransferase
VDAIDHRARVESLQELALRELVLPYGEAWVDDDPTAGIVSAALWMLPGVPVPTAITERVQLRAADLEGDRHAASVDAEAQLAPLRPTAPHHYLGAVGTKPARQGSGHGSAVLRPVLERARREGVDVFLETSSEANVGFYAQLGFSVAHHVQVRDGGPDVWAMILTTRPGA